MALKLCGSQCPMRNYIGMAMQCKHLILEQKNLQAKEELLAIAIQGGNTQPFLTLAQVWYMLQPVLAESYCSD